MTVTGTVYGLVDPRDGAIRYVGQTVRTLEQRVGGKYGPRVVAWMAELKAAGLRPQAIPLRENVPKAQLLNGESEEITRILAEGGTLLNEQSTGAGREIVRKRTEAEHDRAVQRGWRQLADAALATFGGPVPPGDLPELGIPDAAWRFTSTIEPGYMERAETAAMPRGIMRANIDSEEYQAYRLLCRQRDEAADALWEGTRGAWGKLRGMVDDDFSFRLEARVAGIAHTPCRSRADLSRQLSLSIWYQVAVAPWRHLARMSGHPLDDASFVLSMGRDPGTQEALEFLASRGEGHLAMLSGDTVRSRVGWDDEAPGRLLATVTAAYSGTDPAGAVRERVVQILADHAGQHELTQPMADLLVRIDPRALDTAFGPDLAAQLDRELNLPAGTSGRVLRAMNGRSRGGSNDYDLRRAADRSTQTFPVKDLPDYLTWSGRGILAARSVSACIVSAGLAEPKWKPAAEYLADFRALWTPAEQYRVQRPAAA